MLPSMCRHSKALPLETCSFCSCVAPETLLDICFHYVVKHLETICEYVPKSEKLKLKRGVALPVEICERLLNVHLNRAICPDQNFIHIFKDRDSTRLKRVYLRNTDLEDPDLQTLLQHELFELEISNCPKLTSECLELINIFGYNLISLTIGDNAHIFPSEQAFCRLENIYIDREYVLSTPRLKKLCFKNLKSLHRRFFAVFLRPFTNISYLDLSNCSDLDNLNCIEHLIALSSLILFNVNKIELMIPSICNMKGLRHLDISHSKEENGKYEGGSQILAVLVESLPKLTSLDISGTNLAGTGVAEIRPEQTIDQIVASDIPGLASRVNNPFQFLGLYETQYDACLRHDIPAKLIAGNANEEQILIAAKAYIDRSEMLQKVLNELFHLFRFESCEHVGQALNIVLEAMDRHVYERHIQISGSATLFYIVKGANKQLRNVVRVKRRIISTLLNGMGKHRFDDTMMRNGCLTLCQFNIPTDVLFEYERLVDILLHSVHGMQQESFVQRIGIYLLNSLACQVDGQQKIKLGELGAISKMLWLISERLERGLCDDVLEVAWSTMWNVTDETPENCKKFLENKGMEYFLNCLAKFPDREELLRNMMGLLGNVAEVRDLRHYLMTPEYISVFSELLDSISDGIEVSYNAAGVISHIASDGSEVWSVTEPSREYVLSRMVSAIDRWDLNSARNINYRSFEPILYLVKVYDTPECQHWAVWALANLTKVYPEKYCLLIENEGGTSLLQALIENSHAPQKVKQLAQIVIDNCRNFKDFDLDSQLDG